MLERFTDPAREVLVLAEAEARQLSHDHIGPEHILLGLIDEKQGTGAAVLDRLGIAPDAVRAQVEEIVGPGQQAARDELSFDPGGKRVLELSLREALQLGHSYIGTEHLLLGLIREERGVAARVLRNLGVDLNRVRAQVIQLLSTFEGDPTGSAGEVQAQTGPLDALNRAPAHLVALARHVTDLRDGTHGGAESRADKEALFERAVDWLAPVAWDVLEEANDLLLLSRGELSDSDTQRDDDGTLARTWTLSWPEQVERDLAPVTLRAWFGGGFHHPTCGAPPCMTGRSTSTPITMPLACSRCCAVWSPPTCTTSSSRPTGASSPPPGPTTEPVAAACQTLAQPAEVAHATQHAT